MNPPTSAAPPEHRVRHHASLKALLALQGLCIGTSEWLLIDQARIDAFAEVTGDRQWIHVDPERAAAGPFGGTIAHGFLTLSLLPQWMDSAFAVEGIRMGVNCGLNRVRFLLPVPAGARLRAVFKLLSHLTVTGGAQIVVEATVEREGTLAQVCVAETVTRLYP